MVVIKSIYASTHSLSSWLCNLFELVTSKRLRWPMWNAIVRKSKDTFPQRIQLAARYMFAIDFAVNTVINWAQKMTNKFPIFKIFELTVCILVTISPHMPVQHSTATASCKKRFAGSAKLSSRLQNLSDIGWKFVT